MKFILLSFWLLLLPLFQTTLAQDFQSSDAKRAWSKSLLVYEKPDITSNVIGRLIFDEIIREVDNSKTQTEEGTWVKLKSPYEGYYLKQQEADPFSVSGSDKEKRKSHFRSTRQGSIQETPKNEEDEENVENAEKKEETSGFFSHLFGSFFKDDEEQTEKKSEQKKRNVSRFFNQKKGSVWIGLGMGVWSLPEERGYNTSSMSLDLFLEFTESNTFLSKFRFGYNQYQSTESGYPVSTSSIYGVFKLSVEQIKIDNARFFVCGGAAWIMSSISENASGSDQGIGLVGGLGGNYGISDGIKIGGQLIYFSKQADFGTEKRYVGATHLQLTGSFGF